MPLVDPYVEDDYWDDDYVGDAAPITVSAPRLLLSEILPLRTSRMLGDYADDFPLPIVIGDLTNAPFPLGRLSATEGFAADHPMQITGAFVAKQAVQDWEQALVSDDKGRTWTVVRFAAPVPDGDAMSAVGRGLRDPSTGELLQNPADIVERVFRIAGRDDDFSDLRAECSRLNLIAAGRISEMKSIKETVDDVTQAVGAIWSPGMGRLYPSSLDPAPILDLDKSEVSAITANATLVDTADILRLSYDRSDASGKPLHYIELTASPLRFHGISKEIAYPLLRTPANAEAIGRPVLQRLAGQRYAVTFNSSRRTLRPGMWVRLVAHPEWELPGDDPVIMILGVEVEPHANMVRVTGETLIGDKPVITVTAHSIALPDATEEAIEVSVRDGVATFTAHDADGRPLAGARISLDGGQPKTTDAQGNVSFVIETGTEGKLHEIAFEAPGFLPQIIFERL